MSFTGKLLAAAKGALLLASMIAPGPMAMAENLLVTNYETTTAVVQGLMEPIQPFVGGTSGSTANIIQLGNSNFADVNIQGNGSLALIQQAGASNRAVQAIQGSNSAQLLVQGGHNNSVYQASQGNDNFQLVGVSGRNNQVAYIQRGDSLAGVLDVRDSVNSNVLAIQTPQSGRYMMPSGLRGLHNKTVVVVPGRMYVLPKR